MSILKTFQNLGSKFSNLNGKRPTIPNFKDSKLHNTYSLNGIPNLNKNQPSNLDLDGKTPSKYIDNLPK